MRLMHMRVLYGSSLIEPLDGCSIVREGMSFAKDPLILGSPSFGVLPQHHRLYTYRYYNETKCTFEPHTYTLLPHTFSVYECAL